LYPNGTDGPINVLGITHDDGRKSEKNDYKRRIWKEVI
jgi:hypothetical protein